ncbi:MAG TPA: Ig-like domain-containing protein, partial [Hymenobacter sp.]
TTDLNKELAFNILTNDTDADGFFAATTVDLDPATPGTNETTRTIMGVGTFAVTATGELTFTPALDYTGTANITYTVRDNENALSNPGTISITVGPPPVDLATITASANPISAGAVQTLTVVASNSSAINTATNVVQTVQLPTGLTDVTFGTPTAGVGATLAVGSTPTYNSTTGLVTFATIASQAAGTTGNVGYTVSFGTPGGGSFPVVANVNSTRNSDTNPANNTTIATIVVTPRFDLVTTLSGPTTAVAGNQVSYNVTSANNGPGIAPGVIQTVTGLPTGLMAVYVSNGGTYTSGTGTVTFPAVSSFPSGLSVANTISFLAPASGTAVTPVATLTPNTTGAGEINSANNTASLNGTASTSTLSTPATTAMANVQVSALTTSASSVAANDAVTVNVTYANAGPNQATGVVYQLALQPGFTVATLQIGSQMGTLLNGTITYPNGASYSTSTGVVSFNATSTTLNSAGAQSYDLVFTAPSAGQVLVAASVRSTTSDPVSANNFFDALHLASRPRQQLGVHGNSQQRRNKPVPEHRRAGLRD